MKLDSMRNPLFCPSTDISESTHVLGVRGPDGRVKFFNDLLPLPVVARDQFAFEDLRHQVRLTGRCIQNACSYWIGLCTLGQSLVELSKETAEIDCAIKSNCRWFSENGPQICSVCEFVMRGQVISELEEAINDN
jgi:hypothetical protein